MSTFLIIDCIEASTNTCTIYSFVHMNVQYRLVDSLAGSGHCSYAGVPLRQYRAYTSMSSEWKYRCHYIS